MKQKKILQFNSIRYSTTKFCILFHSIAYLLSFFSLTISFLSSSVFVIYLVNEEILTTHARRVISPFVCSFDYQIRLGNHTKRSLHGSCNDDEKPIGKSKQKTETETENRNSSNQRIIIGMKMLTEENLKIICF